MTTQTITRRDQALHDIFVTALEGGVGYWSVCTFYQWSLRDEAGKPTSACDVFGFKAVVFDTEDEDRKLHTIDRLVIEKGMRQYAEWAIDHSNTYFAHAALAIRRSKWDELDADADIADCIVQLGLFGEIVFG